MPCVGGQSRFARFARPASAAFLVADGGTGDGVKVRRRVRRPGHRHRIRCAGRIFFPSSTRPTLQPSPPPKPTRRDLAYFFFLARGKFEKNREFSRIGWIQFQRDCFFFFFYVLITCPVFFYRSSLINGNYGYIRACLRVLLARFACLSRG